MSIEVGPKPMGKLDSLLIRIPAEKRGQIIRYGLENILKTTLFRYPQGFEDAVRQAALDGYAFEIVANHTSHPDALPAAKVGTRLAETINPVLPENERITGFLMPFALSMETGTQGQLLATLYNDIKPSLEKLGTTPVYTATENDIEKKRVSGTNSVSYSRQLLQGVKNGKSIIIFPEGKVEGGRRNEKGNIKGMQEFRRDSLQQTLRISTAEKEKVAVVPVGISGGYNVYDPQKNRLTIDALFVAFGISDRPLFRVRVGMPIIMEGKNIKQIDSRIIDRVIARLIIDQLPGPERGTFY